MVIGCLFCMCAETQLCPEQALYQDVHSSVAHVTIKFIQQALHCSLTRPLGAIVARAHRSSILSANAIMALAEKIR